MIMAAARDTAAANPTLDQASDRWIFIHTPLLAPVE
jgi:hypothetical protein